MNGRVDRVVGRGIRVIVERRDVPLAGIALVIGAGAADEEPGEHGAAHFLEHMVFKGTAASDRGPGRRPGESVAAIEALGGDLGAWTSHDETSLFTTVESGSALEAIAVIAEMICAPTLDPSEHRREQRVVAEEIRSYDADPDSVLEQRVAERVFADHAYGRQVTGSAADVDGLAPEALRRFRDRNHGADRMVLAVAGDVDPDAILAAVELGFGSLGASAARDVPDPVPRLDERVIVLEDGFDTALVEIAWPGPPGGHADQPALDVLMGALVGRGTGEIVARVQGDDHLALDVWSGGSAHRRGGSLTIGLAPRPKHQDAAVLAALEVIADVVRHGLPSAAFFRSRDALVADALFARESVDAVAQQLALDACAFGDPAHTDRHVERIAALDPLAVRDAARRWLDPSKAIVVALADVDARRILPKLHSPIRPGRASTKEPQRSVLFGGLPVWVLPDAGRVAAAHAVVIGGGLAEQPKTAGSSRAWARTVGLGAADLDAAEFAGALDDLSATFDADATRTTMTASATFPASWTRGSLELFCDALVAPKFTGEDWGRIRDELREDLETRDDRPEEEAADRLWEALWPGHPWRLAPSASTLAAISPKRIEKLHQGLFTTENLAIAVAGGVEPDAVIEILEERLAGLRRAPYDLEPRPEPGPVKAGVVNLRSGRDQGHVVVGMRGVRLSDPDRPAVELLGSILDGQAGPLFMELREQRGLAYDVWASSFSGLDGGVVEIGLSCDPARIGEVRRALGGTLDRLAERGFDEALVERYRRSFAGRTARLWERASGRAADAATGERFGLPWGIPAYRARVQSITSEAVADAARRILGAARVEVLVEPIR